MNNITDTVLVPGKCIKHANADIIGQLPGTVGEEEGEVWELAERLEMTLGNPEPGSWVCFGLMRDMGGDFSIGLVTGQSRI